MKKSSLLLLMGLLISVSGSGDHRSAVGSINRRIRRIAEQGNIARPEEITPHVYAGSIDYNYPEPDQNIGVYLYNRADSMQSGQEGILQIGLQSKSQALDGLPPFNMVLLVDASASMTAQIPRLKDAMALFMGKVRSIDSLSLVGFNDVASVLFPSSFMDAPERKRSFVDAVGAIRAQGGTNIEAGLDTALEQALVNLRHDAVNIVVLVSDGTDLSARRREEGARSGAVHATLSWKNRNDLDLHVVTPGGEHIYYGYKKDSSGGELDVDMNITGESTEPIENIFWLESVPTVGIYRVFVQNFKFHEDKHDPTPFRVELKNGQVHTTFEGQTNGVGNSSNVEVCSFQYAGDGLVQTFQIIGRYKEKNIAVSTVGIGDDFDAELMQALAEESHGASRFLEDGAVMMDIFGSDVEFERLAIPAVRNLTIELEFLSGVEVLGSDGAVVMGNRLSYESPTLNTGDYRTFLSRYRLPVFAEDAPRTVRLAVLTMRVDEETVQEKTLSITLAETVREDPMTLYASAILRFAENLKEIGERYYQDKDKAAALQKTRESAAEIDATKRKLNGAEAFADESFILAKYIGILDEKTETDAPSRPQKSVKSTEVGTTSRRFNK
ncbi:MAG: VWA domain-containing protein [Treponema sp.]|jgi:Ca-activated chloride channel family protein|nr:VWA domain-containing protein [Treponema sp.]